MKGVTILFKNRPNQDGTVSSHSIDDCLIAQNGTPTASRPQVIIHLPKEDDTHVSGAWVDYEGHSYHIIGETVKGVKGNVPTRWNRYAIGERIAGL